VEIQNNFSIRLSHKLTENNMADDAEKPVFFFDIDNCVRRRLLLTNLRLTHILALSQEYAPLLLALKSSD
jgi:hypothetical protein